MQNTPDKLTRSTGVRFNQEISARLEKVSARLGEKPSSFIRRAVVKLLVENEAAAAPAITPEQITLLAKIESAQARGDDVARLLVEAMQTQCAADATAAPVAPARAA